MRIPLASPTDGTRWGELALGARRNGLDYTPQDRENLMRTTSVIARAMALSERVDGVRQ